MAAKLNHTVKYTPKTRKEDVNAFLADLQNLPQHKWIPIEGIQADEQAFCTPRQAGWMVDQVAKRVEGAQIELTPVPVEAEAE